MTKTDCLFCNMKTDNDQILLESRHAYVIYDKYPVNPGHALIIPKRHMKDYFDLEPEEEAEIWALVKKTKALVDDMLHPDGWNIGINCGKAAGQTVFHLHVHLIPRYNGDVDAPEGGVRGVVPKRMKYK